jgi:hypothetical protein
MSEAATPTRRELEAKIVARAWADESYRAHLKQDPRAALAEETGITVPEAITIEVLEETPEKAYLVIPVKRAALADEALDVASGGTDEALDVAWLQDEGAAERALVVAAWPWIMKG